MSAATTPPLDARLCQSLFIAGTDTGVGKTWVAVKLIQALAAQGLSVAGFKPIAAGAEWSEDGWRNDDARQLIAASSGSPLAYSEANPYCLQRPTSPHLAAAEEHIDINIDTILLNYQLIKSKFDLVIAEGAGGWLAPIGPNRSMQDVAAALALPVLLVVGLRLGCINHALLTVAAIRAAGLPFAGWIANPIDPSFADRDRYVLALQERLPGPLLRIW
jgi:dethiobiotin synthetase